MRNLKGHSIRKLRTTVLDVQVYVRHTNTPTHTLLPDPKETW